MISLSTLCYIEKDGQYLMLHRTVKKNDINKDKWIGVGGHFEADESPEECVLREVREETGYTLTSWKYRAIVTFVSGDGETEYMSLFTADAFTGEPIACDEGELAWVDKEEALKLNIWEGDKIFFRLLNERSDFFSLKLVYDGNGGLVSASLDGKEMNFLMCLMKRQGKRPEFAGSGGSRIGTEVRMERRISGWFARMQMADADMMCFFKSGVSRKIRIRGAMTSHQRGICRRGRSICRRQCAS